MSSSTSTFMQSSDILYYEVLDIPLPELQGLKTLKVAFHHATKDEVSIRLMLVTAWRFAADFCCFCFCIL